MLLVLTSCDKNADTTPSTTPDNDPPAHVHAFGEWTTVSEASCREKGSETRTCECGEREERETDVLEHTYIPEVTAPTCTAEGYTTYKCECGENYVADQTAKLSHELGEWQILSSATCTAEGERKRECKNCDHAETEKVASLGGHQYGEWQTLSSATCTTEGTSRRECKNCDHFEDKVINSGHDMGAWRVTATATCTENGERRRSCAKCSYAETEIINSFGGHRYGEWKTVTAATCDENGENRRECLNESCEHYETETVSALSHQLGSWTVYRYATCGVAGEERRTCKNCDYYDTRPIAATGNHTFGVWPTSATTTETRKCSYCSATESRPNLRGVTSGSFIEVGSVRNDPYVALSTSIPYRRQGGCFTGDCIYQALITKNEETARIMKKDLRTGKTTFSECVPMGHANDMTYNPNTNCVYVVTGKTLHVFDADTLEYKGTKTLSNSASGISYNAFNDTYVGFSGGTITIFGSNFKKISSFTMSVKGDSTQASQGICSDENYIYSLYYGKSNMDAYVYVYDYDGNYITTINIDFVDEPENVSVINGEIYVGTCTQQPVFTVYKINYIR